MQITRSQKLTAVLLMVLLGVSLLFTTRLLLMEYLRLLLMGMTLALAYIPWKDRFGAHPVRVSILAVAVAYVVFALDPSVNGTAVFKPGIRALNAYRILSLSLLVAAAAVWLAGWSGRPHARARFLLLFQDTDRYVLVLIVCGGIVLAALELLQACDKHTSLGEAVLGATKCGDLLLAYGLTIAAIRGEPPQQSARAHLLMMGLLVLCAVATLAGGVRATRAYYATRIPAGLQHMEIDQRATTLIEQRERVLRMFSLGADEALLLYEAGYYAGLDDAARRRSRMARIAGTYPRVTLQEADLAYLLATGQVRTAVHLLEQMPLYYRLTGFGRAHARDLSACQEHAGNTPTMTYLLGLLALHEGNVVEAQMHLRSFLAQATNHANAASFLCLAENAVTSMPARVGMDADGWLEPRFADKPLAERGDRIILMYNQQVRGLVWLPTGSYDAVVWARDEGTPWETAQACSFDPSCKMSVWLDRTSAQFTVLSTNRAFLPFIFSADILGVPSALTIEFTNDQHDQARTLDRNLAVSRVEFIRRTAK